MTPLEIAQALAILSQSALTAAQVKEMLERGEISEADVIAQLDSTDATIQRHREEN